MRVPAELLITYRFLTENDERGRNRIFIRLQRRATAVALYFQRALALQGRVALLLLISYFLGESSYGTPYYISLPYRKRRQ